MLTEQERIRACIRSYMAASGLSFQDLAGRMGYTSAQTVQNYLSSKPLSEKTVRRFSEALGYPFGLLLEGKPYHPEDAIARLEERVARIEAYLFGEKG